MVFLLHLIRKISDKSTTFSLSKQHFFSGYYPQKTLQVADCVLVARDNYLHKISSFFENRSYNIPDKLCQTNNKD